MNQDNSFKNIISFLLISVTLLTPLLVFRENFYAFTDTKYIILSFFGSLLLSGVVYTFLSRRVLLSKDYKIILYLVGGFLLSLLLSSVFSENPSLSIWSTFDRGTGFLTYFFSSIVFMVTLLFLDRKLFLNILKAVGIVGVLISIVSYLGPQMINLEGYLFKHSLGGGTLGNTTFAGSYLIFSIFSLLIINFENENNKKLKVATILAIAFIFLSPIFFNAKSIFDGSFTSVFSLVGEARAAIAALVIGLFGSILIYYYFSKNKLLRLISKILILFIFLSGIVFSYLITNPGNIVNKTFINEASSTRIHFWQVSMFGISERPFIGHGLESYQNIFQKYFDPISFKQEYLKEIWVDKTHNQILEITLSSGFLGLILYLSIIGFVLIVLIRKIKNEEDNVNKKIGSLFFGLLIAYFIQNLFAFDTVTSLLNYYLFISLILYWCFGQIHLIKIQNNKSYKYIAALFLGLISIIFLSIKPYQESRLIRGLAKKSVPERILLFEKSFNMSPMGGVADESFVLDIYQKTYRQIFEGLSEEEKGYAFQEVDVIYNLSVNISEKNPLSFRANLNTARLANLKLYMRSISNKEINDNLIAESIKYSLISIKSSPRNPQGYWTMSQAFIFKEDLATALKFADMAVYLDPTVAESHDVVIRIAKLTKDITLINKKIKFAQYNILNYEPSL